MKAPNDTELLAGALRALQTQVGVVLALLSRLTAEEPHDEPDPQIRPTFGRRRGATGEDHGKES